MRNEQARIAKAKQRQLERLEEAKAEEASKSRAGAGAEQGQGPAAPSKESGAGRKANEARQAELAMIRAQQASKTASRQALNHSIQQARILEVSNATGTYLRWRWAYVHRGL